MAGLIERYVSVVIRRLPENEREDVKHELTSNIYDMLSENPDDDQITAVLNGLGSPALLAHQYRQEQRYLISPAFYTDYNRTLKWIVPVAGFVLMVIGLIAGVSGAFGIDNTNAEGFTVSVIAVGVLLGVAGALNALILTTAGFAIAERVTSRSENKEKTKWTVDQLPPAIDEEEAKIPLSKSINELVLNALMWSATILILLGLLAFSYIWDSGDFDTMNMVAESFVLTYIPACIVFCLCGIIIAVLKIVEQRWTPIVCGGIIIFNLVCVAGAVFLAMQPQIFSPSFVDISRRQGWWDLPTFQLGSFDLALTAGDLAVCCIVIFVIAGCLHEIVMAVIKTVRAQRYSQV